MGTGSHSALSSWPTHSGMELALASRHLYDGEKGLRPLFLLFPAYSKLTSSSQSLIWNEGRDKRDGSDIHWHRCHVPEHHSVHTWALLWMDIRNTRHRRAFLSEISAARRHLPLFIHLRIRRSSDICDLDHSKIEQSRPRKNERKQPVERKVKTLNGIRSWLAGPALRLVQQRAGSEGCHGSRLGPGTSHEIFYGAFLAD